jgi:hypothetical protein
MQRRHFLTTPALLLTGVSMNALADIPKVQSLDDVLRWLDKADTAATMRSTTDWKMRAVLEHLAQSVEMSMEGFPQPKSALFQSTAGAAAFAFFKLRGRMSHGLTEPIPGAQALTQTDDWKPGAARLRAAVRRFQAHSGALQPHFAYGALSHADFALAHTFHFANHQDEIVLA